MIRDVISNWVLGWFWVVATVLFKGKKVQNTFGGKDIFANQGTQKGFRRIDSEGEPSRTNSYREHSARVDRAYFIGSYEMYEHVNKLIRSSGLDYQFSYRGTSIYPEWRVIHAKDASKKTDRGNSKGFGRK